jgi:5-formyltetrahydrofolate cyclo-ligase
MNSGLKKQLRAYVRDQARKVGGDERAKISAEIVSRIEASPQFRNAGVVALYRSLPDEVHLEELLRRWVGVKRLALPHTASGAMFFREYTGEDNLVTGEFGIEEPSEGEVISPQDIDLMIVPGVAFDRGGHRLGRGGGYYDRFLSQLSTADIYKMGVCFPYQMVDNVPIEPHDVVMDEIISSE